MREPAICVRLCILTGFQVRKYKTRMTAAKSRNPMSHTPPAAPGPKSGGLPFVANLPPSQFSPLTEGQTPLPGSTSGWGCQAPDGVLSRCSRSAATTQRSYVPRTSTFRGTNALVVGQNFVSAVKKSPLKRVENPNVKRILIVLIVQAEQR